MRYTKIPDTAFQNIQMNAGILVKGFDPNTGEYEGLLGATTGGVNFTATPSYSDYGDDIDNCPKNSMELKKLESWEVTLSGTFVTIDAATAKTLISAADVDSNNSGHINPRNDVKLTDFEDIWWIGDYSDENDGSDAGYCAVHMLNALNTGGFQIQSTDKGKGNFAFTFTGHYSMNAQDTVPFEIFIKGTGDTPAPYIMLDKHTLNLVEDDTYTFRPSKYPSDATISWSSGSSSVATVTNAGVVTAEGEGSTTITATIQVPASTGTVYTDTCAVVVTAASEG